MNIMVIQLYLVLANRLDTLLSLRSFNLPPVASLETWADSVGNLLYLSNITVTFINLLHYLLFFTSLLKASFCFAHHNQRSASLSAKAFIMFMFIHGIIVFIELQAQYKLQNSRNHAWIRHPVEVFTMLPNFTNMTIAKLNNSNLSVCSILDVQ